MNTRFTWSMATRWIAQDRFSQVSLGGVMLLWGVLLGAAQWSSSFEHFVSLLTWWDIIVLDSLVVTPLVGFALMVQRFNRVVGVTYKEEHARFVEFLGVKFLGVAGWLSAVVMLLMDGYAFLQREVAFWGVDIMKTDYGRGEVMLLLVGFVLTCVVMSTITANMTIEVKES